MSLTDEHWRIVQHLLLPVPQPVIRGLPFIDRRAVLDGILWKVSIRQPWQELPSEFPPWKTCASCHRRWAQSGLLQQVYLALYIDLADRGGLNLSRALRDGTLTLICTTRQVYFQVPAALQGSWQLATARLLLSLATEELGPRIISRPRFRPRLRR